MNSKTTHSTHTTDKKQRNPNRVVVFDTETSGLPDSRTQNYRDLRQFNNCRLLSISWIVYEDGQLVRENYYVIKHESPHSRVENRAEHINGITKQMIKSKGVGFTEVMTQFTSDLSNAKYGVAHNVEFDRMVLLTECFRYNKNDWLEIIENKRYHCTKEMGTKRNDDGTREKWPKLDKLYEDLFDKKMRGAHHALTDSRICGQCYFEMKRLKKDTGSYLPEPGVFTS